ncbi:MAG: thioredoxin-dependent thiol peroxidase [Bacteroidota bacterium]|jgi:peroxiredoxin Q/BCP
MAEAGNTAPSFSLMDSNGVRVSLKDFEGRKVVLYFYPKDDTPRCTKEACDFRDFFPDFKKKQITVIGVSPDSIESHKKFVQKYNLPFILLSDEKKDVLKKYNVWKEKNMYGRTYMGVARTTFLINEKGKIIKVFPNVKVNGHIEEVIKAFREN